MPWGVLAMDTCIIATCDPDVLQQKAIAHDNELKSLITSQWMDRYPHLDQPENLHSRRNRVIASAIKQG